MATSAPLRENVRTILAMVQREPAGERSQPVMTEPKVPQSGATSAVRPAGISDLAAALPPELPVQVPEPRMPEIVAAPPAAVPRS